MIRFSITTTCHISTYEERKALKLYNRLKITNSINIETMFIEFSSKVSNLFIIFYKHNC